MNWGYRHVKIRNDILEQVKAIRESMNISARYLPDDIAIEQPLNYFREWSIGAVYEKNDKITYNEQLYNVEQLVVAEEHQTPNMEGMLAIYRPISPSHLGTIEDPIPWVSGMNCFADFYYIYNDKLYKVAEGGSMIPCTWAPDSGIWQWELVEEQ